MTGKPWKTEPRGPQLEAFVGAFGIHTSQFSTTGELIWFACKLFGVDPAGIRTAEEAAAKIEALGKKERSRRAYANRGHLFPNEEFSRPSPGERLIGAAKEMQDMVQTGSELERMMAEGTPQLIDGEPFGVDGDLDVNPAKLLRKVVSAVISAGHASDLYEFPEVLAFFGARLPPA